MFALRCVARFFSRWLARLVQATTLLAALAIALMMLHITLDVLLRNFFHMPLPGTMALVSHYYMAIVAFLPLAFAEQKNAHIAVEVLTERLPAAVQRHLATALLPVSVAVFALLAWRTGQEALAKYAIKAAVVQGEQTLAVWPTYFVLPLGCALMALVLLARFISRLAGTPDAIGVQAA